MTTTKTSNNNNHYKETLSYTNNDSATNIGTSEQQSSLPQASLSSSSSSAQKEDKSQSLKIKFTLSTLRRKYDDDGNEIDNTNVEENGEATAASDESGDGGTTTANNTDDANSEAPSTNISIDQGYNHNITKDDVDMESNQNEDDTMEENDGDSLESMTNNNNGVSNNEGSQKVNGFVHENNQRVVNDIDGNKSPAEDGKDDLEERDATANEENMDDAAVSDTNTRPNRTRSSYEKEGADENDKNRSSKDDGRSSKEEGSIDNDNSAVTGNNNKGYSTTSRGALSVTEKEILGFREPSSSTPNLTSSFLDALSEDQRHVRVRHLPNITGFRRLHKGEIKRDVVLIKKMLKSAVSKGGGRNNDVTDDGSNNETDGMEVDDNGTQASDDETPSEEEATPFAGKVENEPSFNEADPDLYDVFSLPYIQSPYICTDVENKHSNEASDEPTLFSSPQVVESITAFNPPRPPESVGPKKMHRLHRWENYPQDVEIDLSYYRKTVNRTRQELHKTELERQNLEIIGAHLRSHFLAQLQCMRQEMKLLNKQYDATQIKCVKAAELLTSKTRSRGASRGSYVMKDVISVLKSRGEKLNLSHNENVSPEYEPWCVVGVGGISYQDGCHKLGCGWLLPGDKVSSPCGDGIVEKVHGQGLAQSEIQVPQSQLTKSMETGNTNVFSKLSTRVQVKLPFGVGYFHPGALKLIENPASFHDNKLSSRWTAMLDSARMMGTYTDSKSIDNQRMIYQPNSESKNDKTLDTVEDDLTESSTLPDTANTEMEIDDTSTVPVSSSSSNNGEMVSFSAAIMPLGCNKVSDTDLPLMEKEVAQLLNGSKGVVGMRNNPSVPTGYRNWEKNREELRILEGEAVQLRNKVYRQKRIRYLNEQSCNSNKDKTDRFEMLLSEMKTDLNILKKRLNDELLELGIDQTKAEELLTEYHQDDQEAAEDEYKESNHGEKRKRTI